MEGAARSTESREAKRIQKSYFDVLGICCPSEVPLIERILKSMDGIQKVSVIVPSKTVLVEHDASIVSQLQIVKALNQARLEATIRAYGTDKIIKKWPSPYILACGIFLVVSLFQRFFHPLRWLAVAAVAVGLPPIVLRSIAAIRRYTLDINILMLIAVGGALALRDFSEAGFIVFLFTIAEWLETRASHKATAGMSALMSMAPQKAILAETGQVVDARDVQVNTILAVKAGEIIPIDGVVVEGKSDVNEQSLTGESFPVAKQAQSLVWAGTLNIDGYISVKTSALAEQSAVAKMARLVEEAQNSRCKTQRLIDSCAKYYTPATVVIAGVAVIPLMLRVHNPKHWFQLALVLLVSACPCALVLSTPVASFCALLKAARIGLIVKGGDILEALAKTKVVAFDKTGTITRGEFSVVELRPVGRQVTMETLLYWISSIESKSSHPMASALVDHARSKSIEPKPENVSEFQIYPGEGVYGEIDNKQIYIGNKRIATRAGCVSDPNLEGEGMKEAVTLGYVFSGATLIGTFALSDSCRTGVAEAMQALKSLGVKIAMLTGDSNAAALHANNQLGQVIEIVHAGLLPEDKVRIVEELKTKEGPTAMVGDGMNDAPALAAANVGISMGISGSAVAMETSHITLMSNDILRIPKAIRLAKKTHHKIIANILFSVITKIAILALAVAGHPLLWAAVLADVGTCLIVILNSMMLLHTNNPKAKKKFCSSHKSDVHKHAQCGAVHCSDGGQKEHGHRHGHGDQCSKKDSCQSRDNVRCCGETGHVKRKSCKQSVANGCRMEHHGEVVHDGFKLECHGDHHGVDVHAQQTSHGDCCNESGADDHGHYVHGAHVHCEGEHHHHGDDEHIQQSNHVDCCEGSEADTHVHHGHDAHVHCGAEHHDDEIHLEHTTHVDCCNGSESKNEGNNAHIHCGTGHNGYASHQHVISVAGEAEHHGDDAHDKHSGKSVACDHRINVVKHCRNNHTQKKENGGCYKTQRKESETKDCCSSPVQDSFERREIGGCHKVEECLVRACCTSYAHGGLRRREIGKCCRSHRMECGKREVLCRWNGALTRDNYRVGAVMDVNRERRYHHQ